MKIAPAILSALLVTSLAGCVVKGKPQVATPPAPQPVPVAAAPQPPPQPLSMPQTQVQLPPAQPIDPEALAAAPAAEPPAESPPAGRTARTRPKAPATAPPATSNPNANAAEPPPTTPATPPETERGPVREMLSEAESARLKNSADAQKRGIRTWLNSSHGRRLNRNDPTVARIQLLLKASDDAEEKGDMREAADLADRAAVFMRELQSGR